jgi:type I restriction enzyme S subunit
MLQNVPAHWKAERLGQLFTERREKVSDEDFAPLSVTKNGIVPQMEHVAKTNDGDNRKRVRAGDFVINSRSDRRGSSGLSEHDGSVSLISIVLEPRHGHPPFLHYLLKSYAFQEEFYRFGHGIVADLWTTRFFDMKGIQVGIPDVRTQRTIAAFLDRETARIDQLIEKKQRLVALLQEKQSASVTSMVTGLTIPGASKVTNSRFLPVIPSHWRMNKLKFAISRIEQGWSPECEARQVEEGEWGVLKVGCVNYGRFRDNEHKALPKELKPRSDLEVVVGDLLMSRANTPELVGSVALVDATRPNLMLCDKLYRIVVDESRVRADFLHYALNDRYIRRQIETECSGASQSMQNLSQAFVREIEIALPPLHEQDEIIDACRHVAETVGNLATGVDLSIDRLREFRSALITSAVTGQIDVATRGTTDRRLEAIEETLGADTETEREEAAV